MKDVRFEGPDYVRQGEDVSFTCNYDMEKDMLYAVKWYRGSEEFYRQVYGYYVKLLAELLVSCLRIICNRKEYLVWGQERMENFYVIFYIFFCVLSFFF